MNPVFSKRYAFVFVAALGALLCRLQGTASAQAAVGKAQPVAIAVRFKTAEAGFVSLALYDQQSVLARSLAYALPVTAGEHELSWDGTTDLGLPAAAGSFEARGIFFKEPPKTKFLMKVGKNGNPPWRTPDGKGDWGANLGGPSAICANSDSLMMGWSCVEDGQITGIQQTDVDGNIKLRYFSFYPWDARFAGAMDETNFYLGILNANKKQLEIAEYKLGQPRGRILTPLPTKPHTEQSQTRWSGRFSAALNGLAITKDAVYATVAADDVLFVIDRATGAIRRQVAVPSPRGVIVVRDRLLVISDKQIVRLRLDGEPDGTFLAKGTLDAPTALAADAAGNIYVNGSNGQICAFAADGKLLRRIGKTGGAPASGTFESSGLGDIAAMCIGPDGNLWLQDVATGFQRTSRWSAAEGKLQREWFNHTIALSSEVINPAAPTELIAMNGPFGDGAGITAYSIDLSAGTWKPGWHYDEVLDDMYMEDVFHSFAHGGNPLNGLRGRDTRWPVFTYESRHPVTGPNGLKYFMNEGGNGEGAMFVYDASHKPRPVALVGFHRATRDRATGKIEDSYQGGPNNWFTWADLNGDGKMSTDEIAFTENAAGMEHLSGVREAVLDAQLNIHLAMGSTDAAGKFHLVNKILPPKKILASGGVIYDWALLQDTVTLLPPDLKGGDGTKTVTGCEIRYTRETKDAYFSLLQPGSDKPLNLPGIDGPTWWASRNWRNKLARFDKATGKCIWAVGRRAPGPAAPGQMYHPAYLAGEAGGALFITDTLGPLWAWNTDGLYIGHLYNDHITGIEDENTLYGETQQTEIYTDPKTGKIYSVANDTAASIHEVLLPKTTPIAAGSVTLTAAQALEAQPWDPDGISPSEHPNWEVTYTATPPNIRNTMYRDSGWRDAPGFKNHRPQILVDGSSIAVMTAKYDDKNLYLACEVSAKIPPLNSGSELPFAAFVSGSYVDFSFGPNWSGPRTQVRDGDVRVIVARVKDDAGWKTFQQGFWQVKAGGKDPHSIESPAAKIHFDQVGPVAGLQAAYIFGDKLPPDFVPGSNYIVQVAIPLASIGVTDPAGKTIGFDASVAIANAAGDRRERVGHFAGRSEANVVDRPGSAELLPGTWGSITFRPH